MPKKIAAISASLIFLFIALLLAVDPFALNILDTQISNVIYNSIPSLTATICFLTNFGNTLSITIMTVIAVAVLILKKKIYPALFVTVDVSVISAVNYGIKQIFERPRPNVIHLVDAGGFSFPSGHSASSMALFLSLVFVIGMISKQNRTWLKVILLLIPVFIGFTRIYLGVHYFSDVLAGWSYSAALTIIIYQLFQKKTA